MKSASDTLKAHLAVGRQFLTCDLYTISIVHAAWGTRLTVGYQDYRYNSRSFDVTIDGNTWDGRGLMISHDKIRTAIGLEVDTLTLDVIAPDSITIAGFGFMAAVQRGVFDGGRVLLEKAFIDPDDLSIIGKVHLFSGRIAEADATREGAQITVKSDVELLNVSMPRELYQPGCLNTLYDTACGLNPANFAKAGVIASASGTAVAITGAAAQQPAGYFAGGGMLITSGRMSGQARYIRASAREQIAVAFPFTETPESGATVMLYPGCDGTEATCLSRFGNKPQYRGFPYIPEPEVAV